MNAWPFTLASKRIYRWKWDIGRIAKHRVAFEKKVQQAKRNSSLPDGRTWYAYDTLSNLTAFQDLLPGDRRNLIALANGDPILDIGCGDGDLAFFFESLGLDVHAIDHPATNYNGMAGVNLLKSKLNSGVKLIEEDLDRQFCLPRQRYGLTLLLGILYHLRNPYYVLDSLSLATKYCILSTRIAALSPDGASELRKLPVAYLLGDRELNNDHTNFWIFSETGLKTMLDRTGWYVRDCFLESARLVVHEDGRLLAGWYEPFERTRWTRKRFSFQMQFPFHTGVAEVASRFALPDILIAIRPAVSLQAFINGSPLEKQSYSEAGEHIYRQKFSVPFRANAELIVEFEVDEDVEAPPPDTRKLGVLVLFDRWFPLILIPG